jgi:hypothetical protein
MAQTWGRHGAEGALDRLEEIRRQTAAGGTQPGKLL